MDYQKVYERYWQDSGPYHWKGDEPKMAFHYKVARKYLKNKNKVLDVGCGDGVLLKLLPNAVGLEISEKAIKFCRDKGLKNKIVKGSCLALPFKAHEFDGAAFLEVIEHLEEEDVKKALKELHRVVKKDGIIVLSTPQRIPTLEWHINPVKKYFEGGKAPIFAKIILKDAKQSYGHIKEYIKDELAEMFKPFFKIKYLVASGRKAKISCARITKDVNDYPFKFKAEVPFVKLIFVLENK